VSPSDQAPEPHRHPVLELLRERVAGASRPGARADGERVALVLEGGGMRGVVSAGMTAALERGGFAEAFDLIVGTSAGAINGAALLAGVARGCVDAYSQSFTTRRFINPYRLLVGRAAIDVAYALDHDSDALPRGRHERTASSPVELHCIAVDVDTCEGAALTDLRTHADLRQALLASTRMPWVGGEPVPFRGRRYLDGGLAEAIPLRTALALGATHALVLQTRPWGVPRSQPHRLPDQVIRRRLRAIHPGLIELYERRVSDYETLVEEIGRRTREPWDAGPHVCGVRLPAGAPVIGQLDRRAEVMAGAARTAERHAEALLAPAD
jgi:predicted patatin/cPLA2 family phospholipase